MYMQRKLVQMLQHPPSYEPPSYAHMRYECTIPLSYDGPVCVMATWHCWALTNVVVDGVSGHDCGVTVCYYDLLAHIPG